MVHTPPSTVLRKNSRYQNKAQLTDGPYASLTLVSGEQKILLPPQSWNQLPFWRYVRDLKAPARNCGRDCLRQMMANGASTSKPQRHWREILPPDGASAPSQADGTYSPISCWRPVTVPPPGVPAGILVVSHASRALSCCSPPTLRPPYPKKDGNGGASLKLLRALLTPHYQNEE